MGQRVVGALVVVVGLLVVLGGIIAGSLGVSTGGLVGGVDCGSYFSPDLTEATKRDESLVKRDFKDILRGETPSVGTEARDACNTLVARKALPVWASIGTGSVIALVGLVLALSPSGSAGRVRTRPGSGSGSTIAGPVRAERGQGESDARRGQG